MAKNTLRARLEVLGGEKVAREFAEIGRAGDHMFDKLGDDALKAAAKIKLLEHELKKLDRLSKTIRASISVKDGDLSKLSKGQRDMLAFADALDARTAAMKRQIDAARDSLHLGGGNALRAMSFKSGDDLLEADRTASFMDGFVQRVRSEGGLLGVDEDTLDRIAVQADRLRIENQRFFSDVDTRVSKADEANRKRVEQSLRLSEQAKKKSEEDALAAIDAEEKADREHDRKAQARRDADGKAQKEFFDRQKSYEDAEYKAWWKDALERRDEQEKAEAVRADEARARMLAEQRALEKEAGTLRERERAVRDIRKEWAAIRDLQRSGAISPDAALERGRAFAAERAQAVSLAHPRAGQDVLHPRDAGWNLDVKLDPKAIGKLERLDKAFERTMRSASRIGAALSGAGKAFGLFGKDVDGASRAGSAFRAAGKVVTDTADAIARGVKGAAGDVGRFATSLRQLEAAVGNAALRTGIAALLGALGVGLAALGGAAALGGIAAIAGLAAFDAQKMKNAADAVGMSLDTFTALRYAAASKGVPFDAYNQGLLKLSDTLVKVVKGSKEAKDAAKWIDLYGIKIRDADGTIVDDIEPVLRKIAQIYSLNPAGAARESFLADFGLDGLGPMLEEGTAGMDRLKARAKELGVVLSEADYKAFEKLKFAFQDMWEIVKGLGYSLAREIMPHLMPVLDAVNRWLVENQGGIVKFLVDTFNYLLTAVKDFWALWNDRNAATSLEWTGQFWRGMMAVVDAVKTAWGAIQFGYQKAKPALDWIAGKTGFSSGLSLLLTVIGAQLLGLTGLAISLGETFAGAFQLAASLGVRLLTVALTPILGAISGIIGWPLLLVAGVAAIAAYWDDIGALAEMAWNRFKQTFPNAAKVMEDTFSSAKATVVSFVEETWAAFQQRYPNLAKLVSDLAAAAKDLVGYLEGVDYAKLGGDAWDLLKATFDTILATLNSIVPLVRYLVEGAAWSIKTLLSAGGKLAADAGSWWGDGSAKEAERIRRSWDMTPDELKADIERRKSAEDSMEYVRRLMEAQPQGPSTWELLDSWGAPASPASAATARTPKAAPAGPGSTINLNLATGERVVAATADPDAERKLKRAERAQIAAPNSWR